MKNQKFILIGTLLVISSIAIVVFLKKTKNSINIANVQLKSTNDKLDNLEKFPEKQPSMNW